MKTLSALLLTMTLFTTSTWAVELKTIPAGDPAFLYEGRIDQHDPAAPVMVWQGSRVRILFDGTELRLLFSNLQGQAYFDASVDGQHFMVTAQEEETVACPFELEPGPHYLELFKRSEPDAGWVAFRGIQVADTAFVSRPVPNRYDLRMIFYGDSITAGACNEDGETDQWDDRSTHNNALSYGALTANAFHADYRNIAVSGMGISIGYKDFTAPQVWNRLYPRPTAPRVDLAVWQPDVVFANYGENDDSFTKNNNLPFPADFAERYVTLVRSMRAAYPKALIVILRGGMFGGAKSERLLEPWQQVVATLEAEDSNITHFVFEHWTNTHPRVADHQAMADELIAWLREQREHGAF